MQGTQTQLFRRNDCNLAMMPQFAGVRWLCNVTISKIRSTDKSAGLGVDKFTEAWLKRGVAQLNFGPLFKFGLE